MKAKLNTIFKKNQMKWKSVWKIENVRKNDNDKQKAKDEVIVEIFMKPVSGFQE